MKIKIKTQIKLYKDEETKISDKSKLYNKKTDPIIKFNKIK